jgi:hypothetical protein
MPVCRFRQIVANIESRQKTRRLYDNTITEWQVRTLAQVIAATVPVEKGKKNSLADAAAKIRLRLEDDGGKAENDAPPEVFIEQGSQVAENAPGSYERLLAGFQPR